MAEGKDPMTRSDTRSSRQIRSDIRRTRAQMDETFDAIEDRLTPGELAHEAWSLVRGGSGGTVNRLWTIAKQYPVPAAIVGVGLGWMAYESAGGGQVTGSRGRYAARYADADAGERDRGAWSSDRVADDARDMASDAAASVRRATDAATDKAGELADQARDAVGDVADSMRRRASDWSRQASGLGDEARHGIRQARAGFWESFEDQPLLVGAATLAAGFLVGFLLPSTPREDELMGRAKDSLVHDAVEKGKRVASAAAETVSQAAQTQGLSAEALADKVRSVGRDVAETVKTEVEQPSEPQPSAPRPPTHRAA